MAAYQSLSDSDLDDNKDNLGRHNELAASPIHDLLITLASEILQIPVDPKQSLVAQGLDSLTAEELLESIRKHGYDADYDYLLDVATINSLASRLREKTIDGPTPFPDEIVKKPIPLTGPQIMWGKLEQQGWGSWANISVCVSMPASLIPAAFLPAIAQSLCAANDAMRMVLIRSRSADAVMLQRVISDFQISVRISEAPMLKRDAMRLVEAFEGEDASPFEPSTRALILASPQSVGRHWLCISMHHIFADRVSMHCMASQLRAMISKAELSIVPKPPIGYVDYALWQSRILDIAETQQSETKLQTLLSRSDISQCRPILHLANETELDLGALPAFSTLRPAESEALGSLATQLETTLPLLLHALFSVLVARLTGDEQAICGETDMLLCHVVSNRESHASLRNMVGCLDTSVPVAVRLADGETLQSLCVRTRHAFAETHRCVSALPRGGWFGQGVNDSAENQQSSLFERVAHINIIRTPADDTREEDAADIRVHPLRRVQKTRWGLLLRVTLPPPNTASSSEPSGINVIAFAEHRPLATLAHYCFVGLLRTLLNEPRNTVGELPILDRVERIITRASFAAAQVRRASALLSPGTTGEAFIWDKLVARQQRWYEHNERCELHRDEFNRFIGTAANPFPFTQLDKLAERRFLDALGVPQPRLLHILPRENLQDSFVDLAPSLPGSFVVKPVGAGHSFGVTLIRNGIDLTRNGASFDATHVAAEMAEMADRDFCTHQDHAFRFNFSSFLIEELVADEQGFDAPTDYKVFMMAEKILWIQLHFKEDGHTWVAFVDVNFELLPQPAWDPSTCWRTHGALVCTEQAMVTARKPGCLPGILEHSRRLGARLNIFVRLDWYADRTHGPLMGEMTTFPHMLQPRTFYSPWANSTVKAAWQDSDGVAPVVTGSISVGEGDLIARTEEILSTLEPRPASLEDFLPSPSQAPWALGTNVSFDTLCRYVDRFDLAPWGIAGGDCVALLVNNGIELGGLLLATMNRYVAMPIGVATPSSLMVNQLQESAARSLVVIAGTNEARSAHEAARSIPDLVIIELIQNRFFALASLPSPPGTPGLSANTPTLGPDGKVLILRTSGTTGEPKIVSYTLARLMRAGAGISQSLQMSPAELGISMLPLHHVGGITCNLIAPLLAGAPMQFHKVFDPKAFFDALAGKQGATWCYLVSTMWEMLLEYVKAHPELRRIRPWPRLRLVRSAGSDLPHHVALELADFFGDSVTILPTYGMTEAMPIAAPPPAYRLERPGSVGPALPTVSIEIVDPSESGSLAVVPDGTIGEITVAGPTVLHHDEGDGHAALNHFTPRGYFRTGDLGRLAADGSGWLDITGRIKDAINRGGETLAPAEVEAVLRDYPGWLEAGADVQLMIFARAHTTLHEDVALAVAPLSSKVDLFQLNSWAAQHLPSSMLPQTLVLLPELPRSGRGKLLRARFAKQMNALLAPGKLGRLQVYTLDSHHAAPKLHEELYEPQSEQNFRGNALDLTLESVLEIVRDFVGEGVEVGPETRLADAGVNSLAAVELSERLNLRFFTQLPTWVISDHPTPRALFSQLTHALKKASIPEAAMTGEVTIPSATSSTPEQFTVRPLRVLLLHGEGADADLMDLSMQATHWTGHFENLVEFVFIDAPHRCAPKTEFHPAAADAGLYHKAAYWSWGATEPATLEESIAAVVSTLDELGPVDGIGGICDGALVAALVASRRPELKLYLNLASSPLTRLPANMAEAAWSITCTSIHLISPQDEFLSFQELLDIPKRCRKALLLQHDSGHCVPMLDVELKSEILSVLNSIGVRPGQEAPTRSLPVLVDPSTTDTGHRLKNKEAEGVSSFKEQLFRESTVENPGKHGMPSSAIPSHGHALSDIETLLSRHESVESAVVIMTPAPQTSGQRLYAFIVLDQHVATPPLDLKEFLKAHLPGHLVPEGLVPVDAIPLTGDGTIDRDALIKRITKPDRPYASPRTPLEQALVKIWQKIFMMDREPGIDDDFFELGGYSLLSVILLREIERRLRKKMLPKDLLKLSTIRRLADTLEASNDADAHDLTGLDQTLIFLNNSRLPVEILHGLLAHTAAWSGKQSSSESLLFGMNTEASGQPLFWCCQGFHELSQLAKHLGPDQPVYGMRSGHLVMDNSQSNIESLAKYYASEIFAIQQEGSYLIGGNCQSAKIAFQIALQLREQGRHISLLCLQEQVIPLSYSGRVALFFGDKSKHNPAYYFDHPEESWQSFYDGPVSVNTIAGKHGQFFKEPNIQTLAGKIRTAINEAGSEVLQENEPSAPLLTPILPASARQARIQAAKRLFVTPDEKTVRINVKITNLSTVTWPSKVERGIAVGYWIYTKGIKPPVSYGLGNGLPEDLSPGKSMTIPLEIAIPKRPGSYRVNIDLLDNRSSWFQFGDCPVTSINLQSHPWFRFFAWLRRTGLPEAHKKFPPVRQMYAVPKSSLKKQVNQRKPPRKPENPHSA